MKQSQFTPYVVLMEDPIVHTDEQPECDDPDCPCHEYRDPWDAIPASPNPWDAIPDEPYYSRADEQADLATADYYDEIARQG